MSNGCPKLPEPSHPHLAFREERWTPPKLAHDAGNEMQALMMRTARLRMRGELPAETRAPIWPDWAGRQPRIRCRIVLVDGHSVIREGIAALLALEYGLEIAGCAGDV